MMTSGHILEFTEKISIPHAKALLRTTKAVILKDIYDPTEINKCGKKYSKAEQDIYIKLEDHDR